MWLNGIIRLVDKCVVCVEKYKTCFIENFNWKSHEVVKILSYKGKYIENQ